MSVLHFLGNGSCFNAEFGNNSAYCILAETDKGDIIENELTASLEFAYKIYKRKLILFECGETSYERIIKRNILDGIDEVYIFITHLHTDHVGSLPTLIFFLNYIKNIKPVIYFPTNEIKDFLSITNVSSELYKYDPYYSPFIFKQVHSPGMNAYGYIVKLANKFIYFSGDSKTIDDTIIKIFRGNQEDAFHWIQDDHLDEFYQDCSIFNNDVHMNIHDLASMFTKDERKRITCMHFDNQETMYIARKYGFKIATVN